MMQVVDSLSAFILTVINSCSFCLGLIVRAMFTARLSFYIYCTYASWEARFVLWSSICIMQICEHTMNGKCYIDVDTQT